MCSVGYFCLVHTTALRQMYNQQYVCMYVCMYVYDVITGIGNRPTKRERRIAKTDS